MSETSTPQTGPATKKRKAAVHPPAENDEPLYMELTEQVKCVLCSRPKHDDGTEVPLAAGLTVCTGAVCRHMLQVTVKGEKGYKCINCRESFKSASSTNWRKLKLPKHIAPDGTYLCPKHTSPPKHDTASVCGALARANPEELKPVIENLCRALAAINGYNVDDGMPLQLPILAGRVRDYFGFQQQMENLRAGNLGDLGYFFKRSEATQRLDTGSIVALCTSVSVMKGRLKPATSVATWAPACVGSSLIDHPLVRGASSTSGHR